MNLTIFDVKDGSSSKFAVPLYEDGVSFDFSSVEINFQEALDILRSFYVLNREYSFKEKTKLRRTKKDLEQFLTEETDHIIIDFDKVFNEENRDKILTFFKENDYYIGIIPSRSYDGKTNFNMKSILKIKAKNNKESLENILIELNKELYEYCQIDFSSIREGSYQAPSFSEETLLLSYGANIPESFLETRIKRKSFNQEIENKNIINICLDEYFLRGFSPSKYIENKNLIIFNHPNERTKHGFFMFLDSPFTMNHFNKERTFSIFESVKNKKEIKDFFIKKESNKKLEYFNSRSDSNFYIKEDSRFLENSEKINTLLDDWLIQEGLLKLKSPMGSGKSNIIDNAIKKANNFNYKVLLITNRISVAKDFKEKYDIKLYSDGDYEFGDDLIVQYDSLWKYSLKEFDVVILDEFVSISIHSRNNMNEYSNLNRIKLMYSMKNKICMIADAFLYGLEDKILGKRKNIFLIENIYREDIELYDHNNIDSIITEFLKELRNNRKISVSCSSKNTAKLIKEITISEGFKPMLLTAESSEIDKEQIYEIFKEDENKFWDVLIFTPTLTVGVSNMNDIRTHFHIDENMSVDVISSLQMMKRSRKPSSIHFYVKELFRHNETNFHEFERKIKKDLLNFLKGQNSLLVDIDENGDFKISKLGNFMNIIETEYNLLENNHRESFLFLIEHQFSSRPIKRKNKKSIDIKSLKKKILERETKIALETLKNLEDIDYSDLGLEDIDKRSSIYTNKDKMKKIISEIKSLTKKRTKKDILEKLAKEEIESNFKFINKMKRLVYFLSKSRIEIENSISNIISENLTNKEKILELKNLLIIKNNLKSLKNKYSIIEIEEFEKRFLKNGEFKKFLRTIGFRKKQGVFLLDEVFLKNLEFFKFKN